MGVATVVHAAVSSSIPLSPGTRNTVHGKGKSTAPDSEDYEGPTFSPKPTYESPPRFYGATARNGLFRVSPVVSADALSRVLEEDTPLLVTTNAPAAPNAFNEEETDAYLEDHGLYRGSYKRLWTHYLSVPLTGLLTIAVFCALPFIIWPLPNSRPCDPEPNLPFPLPELFTSIALYSLSYLLRIPIYTLSSLILHRYQTIPTVLSVVLHVSIQEGLRLATFSLLSLHHCASGSQPTSDDFAFFRAWFTAIGWAIAEACVGVTQGFDQLALYRDALVDLPPTSADRYFPLEPESVSPSTIRPGTQQTRRDSSDSLASGPLHGRNSATGYEETESAAAEDVERDLDELIAMKDREELEDLYGIPFINIPVFIPCLQRIDSALLSLGLTLCLSAAYLRALNPTSSASALIVPFIILMFIHTLLAMLFTPHVLPRIGVHSAAYISLLVALGSFFAGLASWGALA